MRSRTGRGAALTRTVFLLAAVAAGSCDAGKRSEPPREPAIAPRIGIHRTPLTEKGFDRDYHFVLVEISGDELFFQAISRTGVTIDAGVIHR